jgi:hypothetical protein
MDRTVIILNCKPEKLNSIKITLNPSRKKTLEVEKPALSSCIEGLSEYCRVSFDLLDKKAQTSVFLIQSTINRLNNWTPKEQSTDRILNNTKIQPAVDKYETFKSGIKEAIKSLYEKPPKTKVVNTARIICIYQAQDRDDAYIDSDGTELNFAEFVQASLIEAQNEIQNKRVLTKVELLLMKVVDAQGKENISEQKRIDDRLILETSTVKVDLLSEVFWDLAVSHNNLKGIKILGIPFKEKEETNSDKPADFNVILLMKSNEEPSAVPMHIGKQLGHNIWHQSRLLPVYWSSSRPALKLECLPSKFVARITPCYSTSAPVVGLIRHIIAHGKPVLLSLNEDTDNLSHFLVQHGEGGPIYLHQLDDTAGSLFDAPEAVEYYKTTVENVRMKDLTDLAKQNLLTAVAKEPHWTSQIVAGTFITTNKNIEYNTRYFPLSDRDTILFASKQSDTLRAHLQPLKTYLLKENLSNEDITVALDIVDKFTALMQSNEVKMFPSTKGVAPKRRELFQELWKELKQLANLCKDQSANHMQIFKQLENFENPGGVQQLPNVENTPTKTAVNKRPRSNSNISSNSMIVEEDKSPGSSGPKSDPLQQLDVLSTEKKVREDLRFKEERYSNKRRWTIDEPVTNPLDKCDKETLFYQYWSAQANKKRAVELEGRKIAIPITDSQKL